MHKKPNEKKMYQKTILFTENKLKELEKTGYNTKI